MMKCGCVSQGFKTAVDGVKLDPPMPVCIVHDCTEVVGMPDLTRRTARCSSCKAERPSSLDLAFFEYRGPGSRDATEICVCGYSIVAHQPGVWAFDCGKITHPFEARGPNQCDLYYCGCRGWD